MLSKRLEKPIYINVKIVQENMAKALERAKAKHGGLNNVGLVKRLIWEEGKPQ